MTNNMSGPITGPQSSLSIMFELQANLQRETYGAHPGDITQPDERIQFIKDMTMALSAELQEMLDEVGWKPWATSRHVNEEAMQGELVDIFHFFMNLCMAANLTPDMLFEKYQAKRAKNIARQEEGYDGITGKCPHCRRALDDDAVTCQEDPKHPGYFICSALVDIVNQPATVVNIFGLPPTPAEPKLTKLNSDLDIFEPTPGVDTS